MRIYVVYAMVVATAVQAAEGAELTPTQVQDVPTIALDKVDAGKLYTVIFRWVAYMLAVRASLLAHPRCHSCRPARLPSRLQRPGRAECHGPKVRRVAALGARQRAWQQPDGR